MDNNSDDEYYSEDFEQEEMDEVVEVIQEIKVPQQRTPPPELHESASDDAILVFKSATGPRLTIQPRKIKKQETPRVHKRTISESSINIKKEHMRHIYTNKSTAFHSRTRVPTRGNPKKINNPSTSLAIQAKSEDSVVIRGGINSRGRRRSQEAISPIVQTRQLVQASHSHSSCRTGPSREGALPYNYRVTTTTICTGPVSGNRKVPGSTNITNRNYTREKRYLNYPPNMRVGVPRPVGTTTVAQRVASAKRMTVNDLKNRINVLVKEVEDLKKDNKCLKVLQNRQNVALKKWEGRDAELPKLLQQHKDEIKATQSQMKKTVCHCRELEDKGRLKDKKISKLETELQSLKILAAKENLRERSELQEQVEVLSANVAGCEKRIRQYMRHIEIMENNHKHQIVAEKQKLIKANNHALELRHEITGLKIALKDKDRLLNYIQMRSTGRNLMKAFHERDKPTVKVNPALSRSFGSQGISPKSRQASPELGNKASSRSFRRSNSFDTNYEPDNAVLEELQKFSARQGPVAEAVVLLEPPESKNHTNGQKLVAEGHCDSGKRSEVFQTDGEEGTITNHKTASVRSVPRESHQDLEPLTSDDTENHIQKCPLVPDEEFQSNPVDIIYSSHSKNEYSKMSKMLESNSKPKPLKTVKKSLSSGPAAAPQPGQAAKKNSSPFPMKSNKTRDPLFTTAESKQEVKPRHKQPPPPPQMIIPVSTGPKTHSDAKREMRMQMMEPSGNNQTPQVQRKRWESGDQLQRKSSTQIISHKPSKVNVAASTSETGSTKLAQPRVKVRSPISKTQVSRTYASRKSSSQTLTQQSTNSNTRKQESSATLQKAIKMKKIASEQRVEDAYASFSDDSCSPNVSELEFDMEGVPETSSLETLIVPPPPTHFSGQKSGYNKLSPMQEGEIRSHEAVMVNFLMENRSKLSSPDPSTPNYPKSQNIHTHLQPKFASASSIPSNNSDSRFPGFFSRTRSSRFTQQETQPTFQDLSNLYDSSRSDVGPSYDRQVFHHQQAQYQSKDTSASARPAYARNPSVPQLTSTRYQEYAVQGTLSYPQVSHEHSSIPRPESRRIFSYSNNISTQVHNNQPMNLPFFSVAGDLSQQMGDHSSNHPLASLSHKAQDTNKTKPTPRQLSHYDPSFFTKLGTWK